MKVKIKRLCKEAIIPSYAMTGDAGLDLTATSRSFDEFGNVVYGTGLAMEIPLGYVGLVFPRSSIHKVNLELTNSVGVIDSGYRGEIMMKFKSTWVGAQDSKEQYEVGERVGQIIIIPYPQIQLEEVDELGDSERGSAGYGSSGN